MENKKLNKLYDVQASLSGQVTRLADCSEKYGVLDKTFFSSFVKPIGLEFEVEGLEPYLTQYLSSSPNNLLRLWTKDQDGSLRNGGVEFISVPLVGENIDYALHELESCFQNLYKLAKRQPTSSIRTSIHVHVDVSEWGIVDVYRCMAFYALFEPLLFSLQPPERIMNPYCWEVTDMLPTSVGIHSGMKYCALNLAPIERQLSVEFRHGAFNTEMRLNRRWIQVVCKLMKFIEENQGSLEDIINRTIMYEDYFKLFLRVFGKSAILFNKDHVVDFMKENALWSVLVLEHL